MHWNTTYGWWLGFVQLVSCYYVHTNDHNLRPMFFLPWNTSCGWWLGFTQPVSCAIMYIRLIIIWDPCSFWLCLKTTCAWWLGFTQIVSYAIMYTPMIIIWHPWSLTMPWNTTLWTVTRIHSVCKLCYYVHTNDHNLRPTFFLTMPWNTTCGRWLGFT